MENEVLRDILLVATIVVVFIIGFFIMKRLDKFLEENYKPYPKDEEPIRIVHNENSADEEILSDIQEVKKQSGKVKIIISNETAEGDK